MPSRFSVGPLGDYDDQLLMLWAALHGSSKNAAGGHAIAEWLEQNRETIMTQVGLYAKLKEVDMGDAIKLLLNDEDPDDDNAK